MCKNYSDRVPTSGEKPLDVVKIADFEYISLSA